MKQNEQPDPKTILMKALAAGAVASFRPNLMGLPDSQKDIVLAYQELKEMIQAQYPQIDVDLLDVGPGSAERQEAMTQQLQAAGVTEDKEILRQAQTVLDVIAEENPESVWASDVAEPPSHLK
jgi:hypothetical protein